MARNADAPELAGSAPARVQERHPASRGAASAARSSHHRAGEPEQRVVILSGLSGAGKTAATKLFEDLGYTCMDNVPGELLPDLAELVSDRSPALREGGHRSRRSRRQRAPGAGGDARRAGRPRHPAPGHLPGGPRRRPDPPLLGDAPPPSARPAGAASPVRSRRSAACSIRSAPTRTSSSIRRTCRFASSRSGSSPT